MGQVEGAGVLGGQRRTLPRQRWWKRGLSVVMLVAALIGVAVVGTTPALAKARARPPVGFTHPAQSAGARRPCQPEPGVVCPLTNLAWSGYVATPISHDFTSASATWIQPAVTCPQPDAWVLFWVGLDGWSPSVSQRTVEQGGSSAQCVNGVPQYEAWWEMYPTNDVQTEFPIAVGDQISASVVYSSTADTYTVTVDDTTTGQSLVVVCSTAGAWTNPNTYTITLDGVPTTGQPVSFATPSDPTAVLCSPTDPCQNSSAEWVVEAPGDSVGSLYPLARFHSVIFTSAHATDTAGDQGSITDSAWQHSAIDLTNTSGTYMASVSVLKKQGTRFRDVRNSGQN